MRRVIEVLNGTPCLCVAVCFSELSGFTDVELPPGEKRTIETCPEELGLKGLPLRIRLHSDVSANPVQEEAEGYLPEGEELIFGSRSGNFLSFRRAYAMTEEERSMRRKYDQLD